MNANAISRKIPNKPLTKQNTQYLWTLLCSRLEGVADRLLLRFCNTSFHEFIINWLLNESSRSCAATLTLQSDASDEISYAKKLLLESRCYEPLCSVIEQFPQKWYSRIEAGEHFSSTVMQQEDSQGHGWRSMKCASQMFKYTQGVFQKWSNLCFLCFNRN